MGLAFLITSEKLQLLGERKVLKQAEYAAMLDAAGMIDAARHEAQRIRDDAQTQAAGERERGYAEGLEQAHAELAAQWLDAAQLGQAQLDAVRDAMARLVTKAVTQMVAGADAARVFESALMRVDALVREERFISVRVAPGDEPALQAALEALRERHDWTLRVAVQVDDSLAPGDGVMHTAAGTLELGLRAQIEAFSRAAQPRLRPQTQPDPAMAGEDG